MKFTQNPYDLLGLGLIMGGVVCAPVFHLVLNSACLTALAISAIILGAVCLTLGKTRPKVSPEVSTLLLETGLEDIAALVEELGLTSKAIYVPSSLTGRHPQALIPLRSNPSLPRIEKTLPQRLIVKYGPDAENIGVLVTTPGSASLLMLEFKPGPTPGELESAITSLLVGTLDLADGVGVSITDEAVTVTVSHPRLEYKNMRLHQCLGSPLASIVASLACEALDKPLVMVHEAHNNGKGVITLGVPG